MITCKTCKNLKKMIVESDDRGNIVKYRPNTCKLNNKEIVNIKNKCMNEGEKIYD